MARETITSATAREKAPPKRGLFFYDTRTATQLFFGALPVDCCWRSVVAM
jgi:hypothetical protein